MLLIIEVIPEIFNNHLTESTISPNSIFKIIRTDIREKIYVDENQVVFLNQLKNVLSNTTALVPVLFQLYMV